MKAMLLVFILAGVAFTHHALAIAPTSQAADFVVVGDRNADNLIQLRTNIELPDNQEINWVLDVEDDFVVADARVTITGLYHPYPEDLVIQLRHEDRIVDITRGCLGDTDLGLPNPFPHPNIAGPVFPPATGTGFQYIFEDVLGTNLALNKTANQSSTRFGGVPSRANDGNVNGLFSAGSVTHTGGALNNLDEDLFPYWMVDLEEDTVVGSIRVWNREDEIDTNERQTIALDASSQLAGSFRLTFEHFGVTATTGDISVNAVAETADEDGTSTPGTGAGESVQAKLQALPNIGQVEVYRSTPNPVGGYTWTVVFVSEPGSVEPLRIAANNITSTDSSITIDTIVEGVSTIWETPEGETVGVSGRMVPAYVMLLPDGTDVTANMSDLITNSSWHTLMTENERQKTFRLPTNTTGRYVRVQLASDKPNDYLSLAEVQVYRKEATTFCSYRGGTPVPKGNYQPVQSLTDGFLDVSSRGHWTLTIDDTVAVQVTEQDSSKPERLIHGYGGLQWWTLDLTSNTGEVHRYHADVTFEVNTLPVYGQLYMWNATAAVQSGGFAIVEGRSKYTAPCYNNCVARFGVGHALSTSPDGSVADVNRVTAEFNARSVLYVPVTNYLGKDHFTFTAYVGVDASPSRGTVTIHTRKCRLDCSNEHFDDLLLIDC